MSNFGEQERETMMVSLTLTRAYTTYVKYEASGESLSGFSCYVPVNSFSGAVPREIKAVVSWR